VGTTDPYDVLTGIDQGEIISLLLWCIYYDPLLCEIQSRNLGYNLEAKIKRDVYDTEFQRESIKFPGLAYMDDTNWISNDIEDLENILEIADEFYKLNDIKINKEKSELLLKLNKRKFDYKRKIYINFGDQIINIQPKHPNESTRILGVWFNMSCKKNYVTKQIQTEIRNISDNINRKMSYITDKQSLYIFNMLIIPKIEYRSQLTYLTEKICDKLTIPYRITFKHKLKFARTAPNAIIENNLIYNWRSFTEVLKQAQITNFFIQINDREILGQITKLRLVNLQRQLGLTKSPLCSMNESEIVIQRNEKTFILSMINLCRVTDVNTTLNKHEINQITGGKIEIRQLLSPSNFTKNNQSLQKFNILFLEQICTLDNQHLLSWLSICKRGFTNYADQRIKKETKWYKEIKKLTTISANTYELKERYKSTPADHLKSIIFN